MLPKVLDLVSIRLKEILSLHCVVLLVGVLGESPAVGKHDFLTTRELKLGTTQGLNSMGAVLFFGANRQQNLANLDTRANTLGLSEGATHSSLEPISTGTRKHLVNAEHVERVAADTHVEAVLSTQLGQVFVGLNASRLKGIGRDLLTLIRAQVRAERELSLQGRLIANVIDTDLRLRHTAQVARLDVRLVLAVAVAAGRAASHD